MNTSAAWRRKDFPGRDDGGERGLILMVAQPQAALVRRPDHAAMASATTISSAATANVICMPAGNGVGTRRRDVARPRCEREHGAHDGRAGDQPEIARQVEHAGDDAAPVRLDVRHDGRVVGGLEQRIADRDDDDRGDVAGNAERRRHHRQKEAAGRHSDQPDDGHAACAETIREAAGRHAGQRGDERTDRQDEPDQGRVEPERAGEIERPDHQRRHHHGRDEHAHGEARAQRGIAEHRQADQGDAARASTSTKRPAPTTAASSRARLSAPKLPRPIVMASA